MIGVPQGDEGKLTGRSPLRSSTFTRGSTATTAPTATTYLNDKIVVCVLESILTEEQDGLIAGGASS